MTASKYYHKHFSLSTIFHSFQRNFFKFFSKLFSSQNVVFALGLHHNPKLAHCLRQPAYDNPLRFFCKAFFASFCKFFKFFFICGKIKRFVLKIHCLDKKFLYSPFCVATLSKTFRLCAHRILFAPRICNSPRYSSYPTQRAELHIFVIECVACVHMPAHLQLAYEYAYTRVRAYTRTFIYTRVKQSSNLILQTIMV